jgi:hypothetical protein
LGLTVMRSKLVTCMPSLAPLSQELAQVSAIPTATETLRMFDSRRNLQLRDLQYDDHLQRELRSEHLDPNVGNNILDVPL